MRPSLLPLLAILILLSLVVLLPKRQDDVTAGAGFLLPGSAAAGADVAESLAQLPPLDLDEPPSWALSRGTDDVLRHLDRLGWGSHAAMVSSRRALERQPGDLASEVLSRLEALGDSDTILISKLVSMLGAANVGSEVPQRVLDALVRRAFSPSDLVAKAALRVLAYSPAPGALEGILGRRHDPDIEVQTLARAALSERVRRGDKAALGYLLDELETTVSSPDLAYVTALGEADVGARALTVLHQIVDQADQDSVLTALASLLVHGDELAEERVADMVRHGDLAARLNGMRMAALSGQIFLEDQWEQLVRERIRPLVLPLMSMLERAVNEGHSEALLAVQLLETMALDPNHSCYQEALDVLLRQGHPLAVEKTRADLANAVGSYLSVAVDRVIHTGGDLAREYVELAMGRLADEQLPLPERTALCRLVAHVDPERAAPIVVEQALAGNGPAFLSFLSRLGVHGLRLLAQDLRDDRRAGLFVYAAASAGTPEALPYLESIVLDAERDRAIRIQALDCIVRLDAGPREDALRRVANALDDPEFTERARKLFWNYL